MISGDMFTFPPSIRGLPEEVQANPNPIPKKKRNQPGTPDPNAEVIALSPKTLMATNRFVCEVCNKGFQRDQNLQLHRRGHNLPWKLKQRSSRDQPRKKVYVCPDQNCPHHDPIRALGDLTGIKKHFSRKHGEKKWKCEKCAKKYAVQSDWKAHSKTCGTREYKCDCGTLFSRKDSFITHRAFCDALTEENARLNSVTADYLSFPNDESAMDPLPAAAFSSGLPGIPPFGPGFDPSFEARNEPKLSLWSTRSSSQLDLDPVRLVPNPNLYTSPAGNIVSSSQMPILKEEAPGPLYSSGIGSGKAETPGPMSATALLQKAAMMGSIRSSGSGAGVGFGVMGSSSSSNVSSLSAMMLSEGARLDGTDQIEHTTVKVRGVPREAESSLTRDFMGAGGRPFLTQDLVKFASISSAMGLSQFTTSNR